MSVSTSPLASSSGIVPRYCRHKHSGQAVVTLGGRDLYLGKYGTAASLDQYNRVVGEWLANGRHFPGGDANGLTVVELVDRFLVHAESYYRRADGTPTSEAKNFREALRPLVAMYGRTPAADLGPLRLKATRERMIQLDWCRTNINRQVGRIKHVFKWAVESELLAAPVHQALATVAGLRPGRSAAREKTRVKPVPLERIVPLEKYLSRQIWAMIRLQMLAALRPGEVCTMRGCDIERGGRVWIYRPPQHKTLHCGHERMVYLGPQAQQVLAPFLKDDSQAYLFSPREAEQERRRLAHADRKTPASCGNVPGSNVKTRARRSPGRHYTDQSYCHAVHRACEKAFGFPKELRRDASDTPAQAETKKRGRKTWHEQHAWHPHQLRHNAGTIVRKHYGLEASRAVMGQRSVSAAEIYAEQDMQQAQRVAEELG